LCSDIKRSAFEFLAVFAPFVDKHVFILNSISLNALYPARISRQLAESQKPGEFISSQTPGALAWLASRATKNPSFDKESRGSVQRSNSGKPVCAYFARIL
jgi:hypothetical protein